MSLEDVVVHTKYARKHIRDKYIGFVGIPVVSIITVAAAQEPKMYLVNPPCADGTGGLSACYFGLRLLTDII